MTHNLFVYGTLMSTADSELGRRERTRLRASSRLLGAACVPGRLYDLGAYPGLAQPPGLADHDLVHGELHELFEPQRSFAWLDPYEGIDPARPGPAEYTRKVCDVTSSGNKVRAWLYLYNGPVSDDRLVPGGNWFRRS